MIRNRKMHSYNGANWNAEKLTLLPRGLWKCQWGYEKELKKPKIFNVSLICGVVIAYEDALSVVSNFCFILLSIDFSSFKEKNTFLLFSACFFFFFGSGTFRFY